LALSGLEQLSSPAENTVMDTGQEISNAAIDRYAGTSILFLCSREALLCSKGEGIISVACTGSSG